MPAGSHGGGSGSHGGFRGSFSHSSSRSSGSGSSGSGSRGSINLIPRGPRYISFWGTTLVLNNLRQVLLMIIGFIGACALLAIFAGSSLIGEATSDINMIKQEQKYYLVMIHDAEVDEALQVDGKVKDNFYKHNKYYITFTFENEAGEEFEGYSFCVYELENIPKKGSTIKLAVNDKEIDADTDAIPMDYKNMTLEDDGEYLECVKSKKNATTVVVIGAIGVAGAIVGIILVLVTAERKKQAEKQEAEQKEQAKAEEAEKKTKCEYCGARVQPEDKVCSQCGARLR